MSDTVYIISEDPDESIVPVSTEWRKIGIYSSTAGLNSIKNPHYERLRALSQGNIRILRVEKCFQTEHAPLVEKVVHRACQKLYQNLHDLTKTTGHKEWWKISSEDAEEIVSMSIEAVKKRIKKRNEIQKRYDDHFDRFFDL